MNGDDAAVEAAELVHHHTRFEKYLENGEFLPLGAWVVRGYDPARIEAFASADDVMETPMAGKCYRVGVFSVSKGSNREQLETHRLQGHAKAKAKALAAPGDLALRGVAAPLALEDGEAGGEADGGASDSTSSDSASPSSSGSGRKRKHSHKKHHSKKKSGKKSKKHGKDKKKKHKHTKDKEDTYGLPHI